MSEIKLYSKAWFKDLVAKTEEVKDKHPEITLHLLLNDLKDYIAHLDRIDAKRGGKGKASEARIAANRINAKKGGWKKGVPRKKNWFVANNEGEVVGHDMDKAHAEALAKEMSAKEPDAEWEAKSEE